MDAPPKTLLAIAARWPHLRPRWRRMTRNWMLVGPCEAPLLDEPPATRPSRWRSAARANEKAAQIAGRPLKRRLHFEHYVILIELREDGGDFPLPVGVIQRLVDSGRRDAEARSGIAIEYQTGAQPLHLLIAGHVSQFRQLPKPGQHFGRVRHSIRQRSGFPACTETGCGSRGPQPKGLAPAA